MWIKVNDGGLNLFGAITATFSLVLFVTTFIKAAKKEKIIDYIICMCSLITFIFSINIILK